MNRRLFFQNIGKFATGLALPYFVLSCSEEEITELQYLEDQADPLIIRSLNPSVIVVGAGAAGMYAASWLKSKGAQVTVFESSDRRGGRVKGLSDFADFTVEAGAEYIHGHNSMLYQWAIAQGGQFVNYSPEDYYRLDGILRNEGQIISDPDVNAAWNFIDAMPYYTGNDITVTDHANAQNIASRVRHILQADLGNDWGTDNDTLSIKGIAQEDNAWTAGNNDYALRNKGYNDILDTQCANILPDILYNKKVVQISYTPGQMPQVQDQEGQWHTADAVILTVPLAILKNNTINFDPPLPSWKINAIQNIGMGPGMKIILRFQQRFWAENLRYITSDLLATVWWYTSKQRGNDHVLTAFVMGDNAAQLSNQGQAAVSTVLQELDLMYGNQVATNSFISSHIEDWGLNPHIGGAYSFPLVNGGGLASRKNLSKALYARLFFAGEATHFRGHNSTVHGALETGLLAAKAVWRAHGM
ncbi:MAG TPA: NAD(P)/FAD-dependent oxidoreductase [Saprospiraceae bacterium]|nr:NAD(P)/FAD-dependent oxidoreductase [Saprospiraceae bacterium]HMQ83889.1 NAD(P)/FAD-dependent oxidoreductase [Saprospiraceae bacterium]